MLHGGDAKFVINRKHKNICCSCRSEACESERLSPKTMSERHTSSEAQACPPRATAAQRVAGGVRDAC